MPHRTVELSEAENRFIEERVSSGRYHDADEVVRAGLRLLDRQEREEAGKIERLRELLREGEDAYERGDYVEVGSDAELDALMDRIGAQTGPRRHGD
ncbi:type II toxin-antitoxin system ParD family antitoxin [Arenibaculum sp.]|jgi:antitoxin ParD1/3/4|uniref:type II toxin-antitoxin system ParD family antitoxin n=1 Tax=Arenibaculum sp. TaxID=2865862 RepID=UPI002E0EAF66|nr:type II toxin-antitoxin system ParD family antitoxin [Arenibaculum sp.]